MLIRNIDVFNFNGGYISLMLYLFKIVCKSI